jgi:hypothetical protein
MTQALGGFLRVMTQGREGFLTIMTHPLRGEGVGSRGRERPSCSPEGGSAMAYRELGMWEVLDVLLRVHRGEAKSAIERVTWRTRKTIRRYVKAAAKLGWGGSRAPDEALAAAVAQRLRPGPAAEAMSGGAAALLAPHREQLRAWLTPEDGGRGLRLSKAHTLLARQGVADPLVPRDGGPAHDPRERPRARERSRAVAGRRRSARAAAYRRPLPPPCRELHPHRKENDPWRSANRSRRP